MDTMAEKPRKTSGKSELAGRLLVRIEEHYEEKFSLDAIAETFHMDKNYLLRVFREITGDTMLHYHNRVRCQHAAELLKRPEISISYISSAVGFQTPSHFSRVFRQTVGTTPAAFRKTHLASPQ